MAKVEQHVDKFSGEKESLDSMIRRFKKQVLRDGTLDDLRKHEFYESKSVKRRKKSEAARRLANRNKRVER